MGRVTVRMCLVGACAAIAVWATPAGAQEPAPRREPPLRGLYGGVPQEILDSGRSLSAFGVDAVWLGAGSVTDERLTLLRGQGVRVYAEFNTLHVASYLERHPDAAPVGPDGHVSPPPDGWQGICPTHEGYRRFRMDAFRALLESFALDGVWLDYHHSHASWEQATPNLPDTCFCERCLHRFQEATGIRLPDAPTPARARLLLTTHRDRWVQWRLGVFTDWVREFHDIRDAVRPGALLGTFHNAWTDEDEGGARLSKLAIDLEAQAAYVDVFSPMPYHARFGHADDPAWIARQVRWLGERLGVKGVPGERHRIWPIVQLADWGEPVPVSQVDEVLRFGATPPATGVIVFNWGGLRKQPEKVEAMGETFRALADRSSGGTSASSPDPLSPVASPPASPAADAVEPFAADAVAPPAQARSLSADDFRFDGPLGSDGASIEEVGRNHFRVRLGAAPEHPGWPNKLNVRITGHARGNPLRLDVVFPQGTDYAFNEYHQSFSYDGRHWQPIAWQRGYLESPLEDTLIFPAFTADQVFIGTQVPLSWEDALAQVDRWRASPHVTVHRVGTSLGGRDLLRLEITGADSPHPRPRRWVHYFANQHPGEHNSQWRLVGLVDWLLSEAAADTRNRHIVHVVLMMSPDAPSHGWYRVNAQGVDMNRSYRPAGADASAQAHEAFLWQQDFEALMASDAPVTTVWAIHTWPGIVEPRITPGPEFGGALGSWEAFREVLVKTDRLGLIEPLTRTAGPQYGSTSWTDGPHAQFGITAVLCEGGAVLQTRQLNEASGATIMRALAAFYRGLREPPPAR